MYGLSPGDGGCVTLRCQSSNESSQRDTSEGNGGHGDNV